MRRTVASLSLVVLSFALSTPPLAGQSSVRASRGGRAGFGAALALSGSELLVGRPGEIGFFPMPPNHAGWVHVFGRDASGRWVERGAVAAASTELGDGFASTLAVSGAVLVVGAPKQANDRGGAYVFERSAAGEWREAARLADPAAAPGDQLGSAVAIAGNVILVAAPGRGEGKGAVLVFRRGASGWSLEATLAGSGTASGDRFGSSIALDGARALVGAPGPIPGLSGFGDQAAPRPGQAYVFVRTGTTWREEARLALGEAQPAALGASVALAGDDAFVAAPLVAQFQGSVARFHRDATGAWREAARIAPSGPAQPGGFGLALAFAGSDLVVGAPLHAGAGRALIFRRDAGGNWQERQSIAGESQFAFFAHALVGSTDILVLGAPGADFFEGTATLFRKDAAGGEWRRADVLVTAATPLPAITGGARECREGRIEPFSCSSVDLMSFLPVSAIGGKRGIMVNDLWGWTDPVTGREIAIVGRTDGTTFIDVTDAANPVYLGELPLHAGAVPNLWRDIKVYADHAFIVADGAGLHGMQVFDLRQLRDTRGAPRTFSETAHYANVHSAHNIVINESSGFAFIVGGSMAGETCGGGLHMVDIRDPKNPKFAGCFADTRTGHARTGYSHDAQCITYNGPDVQYRGREICFGSNESMLSISDVTDKAKPVPIAAAAYPNVAYLHQGWVTEDHRYLFMDDEGDELAGTVPRTRTLVWDIADLDDPVLVKEYIGTTPASDHNLYVKGNYVYESNYVSGLRILDISDPKNPVESGFFDTVPWGPDKPGFAGSWSNYPFFASGTIVVTSMREGVFVLKPRPRRPVS
jgi:choice-of-anchor B domain-containing protein